VLLTEVSQLDRGRKDKLWSVLPTAATRESLWLRYYTGICWIQVQDYSCSPCVSFCLFFSRHFTAN